MHDRHLEPLLGTVSHQPTTLAAMVRAGRGIGLLNLLAAKRVPTEGIEVRLTRDRVPRFDRRIRAIRNTALFLGFTAGRHSLDDNTTVSGGVRNE